MQNSSDLFPAVRINVPTSVLSASEHTRGNQRIPLPRRPAGFRGQPSIYLILAAPSGSALHLPQPNSRAGCSFLKKEQHNEKGFPLSQVQSRCRLRFLDRKQERIFYAEAHISTQPASPLEDAWLSLTYEDKIGSSRAEPSPCRRPQARLSQRRLPGLSRSRRFVSAGAGCRTNHSLAEILSVCDEHILPA